MAGLAISSLALTIIFLELPQKSVLLYFGGKKYSGSITNNGVGQPKPLHFESRKSLDIDDLVENGISLNSLFTKKRHRNTHTKSRAGENYRHNKEKSAQRRAVLKTENTTWVINGSRKSNGTQLKYNKRTQRKMRNNNKSETDADSRTFISDFSKTTVAAIDGQQCSTESKLKRDQQKKKFRASKIRHTFKHSLTLKPCPDNGFWQRQTLFHTHKNETGSACHCVDTVCDCSNRNLHTIPQDLPINITVLSLYDNWVNRLPNCSFCSYTSLETLDLGLNCLKKFEAGSFYGLSRLNSLSLRGNFLENNGFPAHVFKPLQSLSILKLDCMLKLHPRSLDVALMDLQNLIHLYVSPAWDEENVYFGSGFQNMTSLRNLSMACGVWSVGVFLNSSFENLSQLTFLNLSGLQPKDLSIPSGTFAPLQNLTVLDISNIMLSDLETLTNIMWGLRDSRLKVLNVSSSISDDAPGYVNRQMFQYFPKALERFESARNYIVTIEAEAIQNLPKSLKYIDFSGNLLIQDTAYTLSYFADLYKLDTLLMNNPAVVWTTRYHYPVGSGTNISVVCDNYDFPYFHNPQQQEFLMLRKLGITMLDGTEFTSENAQMKIEELLASHSDRTYSPFFVDDVFPHLHHINFAKSGIRCLSTKSTQLIQLSSLKSLNLRSNSLGDTIGLYGEWGPFDKLFNLTHLDLSDNKIKKLPLNIFRNLHRLMYLRLDRNLISEFDVDLSNLTNLMLLNLTNTDVHYLPISLRQHIDRLCRTGEVKVHMTKCPIRCDCFSLDFLRWMVTSEAFDSNFTDYMCRYPDSSTKFISDQYRETIQILARQCAKNYPVFLLALASTLILLCGMIGAFLYRFRWTLRYWYYAAYNKIMEGGVHDNAVQLFRYDVFVSYDSADHRFVARELAPELEQRGLRLLIHGRDFVAGTYIASNIVTAVTESRKTLVVLTRNLLGSDWCNYEIQMANMESIHTGRQVLIFLLKENIPSKDLGMELLCHIRKNTYIPYPETEVEIEEIEENVLQAFWDKLAHDLKS